MAVFCLLAEPSSYQSDTWDLGLDPGGRAHWLERFAQSFESALVEAEQAPVTDANGLHQAISRARESFPKKLATLESQGNNQGHLRVSDLEEVRRGVLNDCGLQDPFLKVKHHENVKACGHYHRLVTAHEKLARESLVRVLTEGVLAGNVFEAGGEKGSSEYGASGLDFYHTLDDLPERPWLVDNYEPWAEFFGERASSLRRVVLFVDNAGADFVLGTLPLARALGKAGATVVLAANDHPCYDDMTVAECRAVLRALAADDRRLSFLLATRRIRLLGSGSGSPQVDFGAISNGCDTASGGAELLILTGAARAVESNWNTRFRCPTLKIAMLKDQWEAEQLGGKQYDLVCRFER